MERGQWHFCFPSQGRTLLAEETAQPLTDLNHLSRASPCAGIARGPGPGCARDGLAAPARGGEIQPGGTDVFYPRSRSSKPRRRLLPIIARGASWPRALALTADLGCGIGGDAAGLAAGATVVGIDRQWLRLAMARENCGSLRPFRSFRPPASRSAGARAVGCGGCLL